MKIKSLFVILVIGIFLIPLLVIGSVMALIHYRSFSRNLVHNLEDNSVIVNDINDADIQIPDIDDDLLRKPCKAVYSGVCAAGAAGTDKQGNVMFHGSGDAQLQIMRYRGAAYLHTPFAR